MQKHHNPFSLSGGLAATAFIIITACVCGAPTSASAEGLSTDPAAVPAGAYALDLRHSSIVGKISHAGFAGFTFRFNSFDANFTYDPAQPDATHVEVTVDPASIDSNFQALDKELTEEHFFNVTKFPKITFVSTTITRKGASGTMKGDLTFMGVTKPVSLDVVFNGSGAMGKTTKIGFSARGVVAPLDFGLNAVAQHHLGPDVTLAIEVEFAKK